MAVTGPLCTLIAPPSYGGCAPDSQNANFSYFFTEPRGALRRTFAVLSINNALDASRLPPVESCAYTAPPDCGVIEIRTACGPPGGDFETATYVTSGVGSKVGAHNFDRDSNRVDCASLLQESVSDCTASHVPALTHIGCVIQIEDRVGRGERATAIKHSATAALKRC